MAQSQAAADLRIIDVLDVCDVREVFDIHDVRDGDCVSYGI
jgi:hypothetical protein